MMENTYKEEGEGQNHWYEVIEISSNEAIALFKTFEEATEFMNIKEDLATRRNRNGDGSSDGSIGRNHDDGCKISTSEENFLIRPRKV